MATAVKQRSLGFSEGLPTRLTAVALHSGVCFAVFADISLSYLSIVCAGFVPAERPGLGHFLLFHCLVLPLLKRLFLILYHQSRGRLPSLQYLKKYLTTKDMVLAIFFDIDAFDDDHSFKELGIEAINIEQKGDDFAYLCVSAEPGLTGEHEAFTRLIGKKNIRGSSTYKPKLIECEEELEKAFENILQQAVEVLKNLQKLPAAT